MLLSAVDVDEAAEPVHEKWCPHTFDHFFAYYLLCTTIKNTLSRKYVIYSLVNTDFSLSLTFLQQSAHPTVLSLPLLSPADITATLETKLWTDQRCLQEQQWQLLVQACLSCPCPLYLEAAYSESMLWTSYSPQASLSLPASLEGLYLGMLAHLERELGRQLVRRAASLISISRWGVTEQVGKATFNYKLHNCTLSLMKINLKILQPCLTRNLLQ